LSMTVTNFMFGLISLAVRHKLRTAAQLAANAFVAVVLLWTVQKFMAPSAHFFLGDREKMFHHIFDPIGLLRRFFVDTLVMPDIQSIPNDYSFLWLKLSIQESTTYSLTRSGGIALAAWGCLLACGAWAMLKLDTLKKFRLVLALVIAAQFALHSVYGNESFLYALNWLPLLVTAAALSTLTRLRWFSLGAAVLFIVAAGHHNYAELHSAFDLLTANSK
jgi:hypothetical protein